MVHDLTAEHDFSNINTRELLFGVPRIIQDMQADLSTNDISVELVLTGDHYERQTKRFYNDYFTDALYCDCCGNLIDKIPWRVREKDCKLCVSCETRLELEFDDSDRTDVLGIENFNIQHVRKPWTIIEDSEIRGTVNDIFLWD